jgi:hypothetical protein
MKSITARAPGLPLQVGAERVEARSVFDLVRRSEEILTFGSLSEPGWYIKEVLYVEGYQVQTVDEHYRVAIVRNRVDQDPLLILIGSIENFLGPEPNRDSSPTGFLPSFAGALGPMLQRFTVSGRRKRPAPLPSADEEIEELVLQAADFAFEIGTGSEQRVLAGTFEVAAEIWFTSVGVAAASLPRGYRTAFDFVLVGTPLWIRSPLPGQLR